jgi:hypothetical protein
MKRNLNAGKQPPGKKRKVEEQQPSRLVRLIADGICASYPIARHILSFMGREVKSVGGYKYASNVHCATDLVIDPQKLFLKCPKKGEPEQKFSNPIKHDWCWLHYDNRQRTILILTTAGDQSAVLGFGWVDDSGQYVYKLRTFSAFLYKACTDHDDNSPHIVGGDFSFCCRECIVQHDQSPPGNIVGTCVVCIAQQVGDEDCWEDKVMDVGYRERDIWPNSVVPSEPINICAVCAQGTDLLLNRRGTFVLDEVAARLWVQTMKNPYD